MKNKIILKKHFAKYFLVSSFKIISCVPIFMFNAYRSQKSKK